MHKEEKLKKTKGKKKMGLFKIMALGGMWWEI